MTVHRYHAFAECQLTIFTPSSWWLDLAKNRTHSESGTKLVKNREYQEGSIESLQRLEGEKRQHQ